MQKLRTFGKNCVLTRIGYFWRLMVFLVIFECFFGCHWVFVAVTEYFWP